MSETSGAKGATVTTSRASSTASAEGGSVAEQAREKLEEGASAVQEKALEVKGTAGERIREEIDTRSTEAGSKLRGTAAAMRRSTEQLQQQGDSESARALSFVADRADRLGNYLTAADADRVLRDVETFARRQPWVAALGGAAAGFLASRFLKASSSARYHASTAHASARPAWQPGQTREGQPQLARETNRQPGSSEKTGVFASAERGGSSG